MIAMLQLFTLLTAVGSGMIAGVFFAFSTFVMKALAKLPPAQGIAAMQSINVVVINPAFMFVFLGTAVGGMAVAVGSISPPNAYRLIGATLYVLGTFGVTMAFNVPLNNQLAKVDPASAEGAAVWADYLRKWTAWNHVRTIAALAAAVLLFLGYNGSPSR